MSPSTTATVTRSYGSSPSTSSTPSATPLFPCDPDEGPGLPGCTCIGMDAWASCVGIRLAAGLELASRDLVAVASNASTAAAAPDWYYSRVFPLASASVLTNAPASSAFVGFTPSTSALRSERFAGFVDAVTTARGGRGLVNASCTAPADTLGAAPTGAEGPFEPLLPLALDATGFDVGTLLTTLVGHALPRSLPGSCGWGRAVPVAPGVFEYAFPSNTTFWSPHERPYRGFKVGASGLRLTTTSVNLTFVGYPTKFLQTTSTGAVLTTNLPVAHTVTVSPVDDRIAPGALMPGYVYSVSVAASWDVSVLTWRGVETGYSASRTSTVPDVRLVYVRAPPRLGAIAVGPRTGAALSTPFNASTSGWVSDTAAQNALVVASAGAATVYDASSYGALARALGRGPLLPPRVAACLRAVDAGRCTNPSAPTTASNNCTACAGVIGATPASLCAAAAAVPSSVWAPVADAEATSSLRVTLASAWAVDMRAFAAALNVDPLDICGRVVASAVSAITAAAPPTPAGAVPGVLPPPLLFDFRVDAMGESAAKPSLFTDARSLGRGGGETGAPAAAEQQAALRAQFRRPGVSLAGAALPAASAWNFTLPLPLSTSADASTSASSGGIVPVLVVATEYEGGPASLASVPANVTMIDVQVLDTTAKANLLTTLLGATANLTATLALPPANSTTIVTPTQVSAVSAAAGSTFLKLSTVSQVLVAVGNYSTNNATERTVLANTTLEAASTMVAQMSSVVAAMSTVQSSLASTPLAANTSAGSVPAALRAPLVSDATTFAGVSAVNGLLQSIATVPTPSSPASQVVSTAVSVVQGAMGAVTGLLKAALPIVDVAVRPDSRAAASDGLAPAPLPKAVFSNVLNAVSAVLSRGLSFRTLGHGRMLQGTGAPSTSAAMLQITVAPVLDAIAAAALRGTPPGDAPRSMTSDVPEVVYNVSLADIAAGATNDTLPLDTLKDLVSLCIPAISMVVSRVDPAALASGASSATLTVQQPLRPCFNTSTLTAADEAVIAQALTALPPPSVVLPAVLPPSVSGGVFNMRLTQLGDAPIAPGGGQSALTFLVATPRPNPALIAATEALNPAPGAGVGTTATPAHRRLAVIRPVIRSAVQEALVARRELHLGAQPAAAPAPVTAAGLPDASFYARQLQRPLPSSSPTPSASPSPSYVPPALTCDVNDDFIKSRIAAQFPAFVAPPLPASLSSAALETRITSVSIVDTAGDAIAFKNAPAPLSLTMPLADPLRTNTDPATLATLTTPADRVSFTCPTETEASALASSMAAAAALHVAFAAPLAAHRRIVAATTGEVFNIAESVNVVNVSTVYLETKTVRVRREPTTADLPFAAYQVAPSASPSPYPPTFLLNGQGVTYCGNDSFVTLQPYPIVTVAVDCYMAGILNAHCGPGSYGQAFVFECPRVVQTPQCVFYDPTADTWSDSGCVAKAISGGSVTCECNHMTDFGARFAAVFDQQEDVFGGVDDRFDEDVLSKYPTVFIVVGSIAGVLMLLCFLAVALDARGSRVFLSVMMRHPDVSLLRALETRAGHAFYLDKLGKAMEELAHLTDGLAPSATEEDAVGAAKAGASDGAAPEKAASKPALVLDDGDESDEDAVRDDEEDESGAAAGVASPKSPRDAPVAIDAAAFTPGSSMSMQGGGVGGVDRITALQAATAVLQEEAALRELEAARSRRGCLARSWAALKRGVSIASLLLVRLWAVRLIFQHVYLGLIFRYDPRYPRLLRVLTIASAIVTNMFTAAFFYAYTAGTPGKDLPPLSVGEIIVLALLSSAVSVPIHKFVTWLSRSAMDAEFRWRYPYLMAELARRKAVEGVLSVLPTVVLKRYLTYLVRRRPRLVRTVVKVVSEATATATNKPLEGLLHPHELPLLPVDPSVVVRAHVARKLQAPHSKRVFRNAGVAARSALESAALFTHSTARTAVPNFDTILAREQRKEALAIEAEVHARVAAAADAAMRMMSPSRQTLVSPTQRVMSTRFLAGALSEVAAMDGSAPLPAGEGVDTVVATLDAGVAAPVAPPTPAPVLPTVVSPALAAAIDQRANRLSMALGPLPDSDAILGDAGQRHETDFVARSAARAPGTSLRLGANLRAALGMPAPPSPTPAPATVPPSPGLASIAEGNEDPSLGVSEEDRASLRLPRLQLSTTAGGSGAARFSLRTPVGEGTAGMRYSTLIGEPSSPSGGSSPIMAGRRAGQNAAAGGQAYVPDLLDLGMRRSPAGPAPAFGRRAAGASPAHLPPVFGARPIPRASPELSALGGGTSTLSGGSPGRSFRLNSDYMDSIARGEVSDEEAEAAPMQRSHSPGVAGMMDPDSRPSTADSTSSATLHARALADEALGRPTTAKEPLPSMVPATAAGRTPGAAAAVVTTTTAAASGSPGGHVRASIRLAAAPLARPTSLAKARAGVPSHEAYDHLVSLLDAATPSGVSLAGTAPVVVRPQRTATARGFAPLSLSRAVIDSSTAAALAKASRRRAGSMDSDGMSDGEHSEPATRRDFFAAPRLSVPARPAVYTLEAGSSAAPSPARASLPSRLSAKLRSFRSAPLAETTEEAETGEAGFDDMISETVTELMQNAAAGDFSLAGIVISFFQAACSRAACCKSRRKARPAADPKASPWDRLRAALNLRLDAIEAENAPYFTAREGGVVSAAAMAVGVHPEPGSAPALAAAARLRRRVGWCAIMRASLAPFHTLRGALAFSVPVAWIGFCLFYILSFGMYMSDAASADFMRSFAIGEGVSALLTQPIVMLGVLLISMLIKMVAAARKRRALINKRLGLARDVLLAEQTSAPMLTQLEYVAFTRAPAKASMPMPGAATGSGKKAAGATAAHPSVGDVATTATGALASWLAAVVLTEEDREEAKAAVAKGSVPQVLHSYPLVPARVLEELAKEEAETDRAVLISSIYLFHRIGRVETKSEKAAPPAPTVPLVPPAPLALAPSPRAGAAAALPSSPGASTAVTVPPSPATQYPAPGAALARLSLAPRPVNVSSASAPAPAPVPVPMEEPAAMSWVTPTVVGSRLSLSASASAGLGTPAARVASVRVLSPESAAAAAPMSLSSPSFRAPPSGLAAVSAPLTPAVAPPSAARTTLPPPNFTPSTRLGVPSIRVTAASPALSLSAAASPLAPGSTAGSRFSRAAALSLSPPTTGGAPGALSPSVTRIYSPSIRR